MKMQENVPISELTTMRLGGEARYVAEIEKIDDIDEALSFAKEHSLPFWFMGGGANTIGRDEGFNGVVLLNKLRGVEVASEDDEHAIVRGMGGEVWDDLVEFAAKRGFSGIEAMSAIPGTVGAAPVQNIGAYGQEVATVLTEVEAYDTWENKIVTLDKSDLRMGYRKTIFNFGEFAGRYFIVAVSLRLRKGTLRPPFYRSLEQYIAEHHETDFSPMNIRKMVMEIRASKLPDPQTTASAGSFFKNVYLDQVEADEAEEKGIPIWRLNDDSGKINSGWLIEECGLKGRHLHGFVVSEKAALVLINEDAKSYADLAAARDEIVAAVKEKFGYTLEQEPVEMPIGADSEVEA